MIRLWEKLIIATCNPSTSLLGDHHRHKKVQGDFAAIMQRRDRNPPVRIRFVVSDMLAKSPRPTVLRCNLSITCSNGTPSTTRSHLILVYQEPISYNNSIPRNPETAGCLVEMSSHMHPKAVGRQITAIKSCEPSSDITLE